jgi:hypothetical protein
VGRSITSCMSPLYCRMYLVSRIHNPMILFPFLSSVSFMWSTLRTDHLSEFVGTPWCLGVEVLTDSNRFVVFPERPLGMTKTLTNLLMDRGNYTTSFFSLHWCLGVEVLTDSNRFVVFPERPLGMTKTLTNLLMDRGNYTTSFFSLHLRQQ